MEGKVSQLAEKLLKEGVERGEAEKQKIIDAATAEAEKTLRDAEAKAATLIKEAQADAEEIKRNAESEIRLAGNQAMDALKQKIAELISMKSVGESTTASLADATVMAEFIKTALANWNGSESSLEVLLPESVKADMERKLAKAITDSLDKEVTFTYGKAVKGGFQVGPASGGYKITFSDSDFADFFNEFLRPRIRTLLFGE